MAAALDSADKTATIELYANGKATGITAEVTESSPAFSFTGLPVYALKGTEITVGTGEDAQTYAIPTADADGEALNTPSRSGARATARSPWMTATGSRSAIKTTRMAA